MKEFAVVIDRRPGELIWTNYDEIRVGLERILKDYEGLVYTEENIPDAKKDRATLNKLLGDIEEQRKEVKKWWMTPYDAFEAETKTLTGMIEKQIDQIDVSLKDFEEQRKAKARENVMAYIEGACYGLPEPVRTRVPEHIYDPKWTNKTAKRAEWTKTVDDAVGRIQTEVEVLKTRVQTEEEATIILKAYASGFSLTEAIMKADELNRQREIIATEMARDAIKADDVAMAESVKTEEPPMPDLSFFGELAALGEVEDKRNKVLCILGKKDHMKDIQMQAEALGLKTWYQLM